MRVQGIHNITYRGLAVLLGIALCLGNTPAAVCAKEADPEAGLTQDTEEILTEEAAGEPDDSVAAEHTDSGEAAGTEDTVSDDAVDVPEDRVGAESAEANGDSDDVGQDSGADASNSDGEPDESDVPALSENDAASISGNDVMSVSDNNLTAVSDNDLDDRAAERQAWIASAQEAFERLLAEKELMALLYHTDTYGARLEPDENSAATATLTIGQTLYIRGVAFTGDDVWYLVQYWQDGAEGTGYVQGYYLAYADEDWIAWKLQYLQPILAAGEAAYGITAYATDTSDITAFPGSYQSALMTLKNAHPNWTFVPMKTGLDFDTSVSKEMGAKSLIQNTSSNAAKGWVGDACPTESGWYYATKSAVAYHMDPRNFLTESAIFQFEQLTFNASYHTQEAVQNFLNGTFMKGTLADDPAGRTYAGAFYEIGKGRKLSPIHLASRVYQEQGKGTSGLISGTYPGYEGYYNFFNVGVNGSSTAEKIIKGLEYAKNKGWNTRYKSLEGGAATIGNNYILKYQDTIYLEKFNVDKNSPYGVYEHQYMQNIQAPASESSSTRKMYDNAGSLSSAFVFKIPVFDNMSEPIPLQAIALDRQEIRLRRPDTVVEDTTGLSAAEIAENTAQAVVQVIFDPADTTADRKITWTTSNQKIATVTADPADATKAVVNAVGTGTAKITAKAANAGGKTATCQVYVSAPIYQVTLVNRNAQEGEADQTQTTLLAGQSIHLSAEYRPQDTTSDTRVVWSSSNEKVATVENGRVTAVGDDPQQNTAVITARVSGCAAGYTAQYTVIVEKCTVTFMKEDQNGMTALGEPQQVSYGAALPVELLQEKEKQLLATGYEPAERVFIGWYTGENGTGRRFDETTAVYDRAVTLYPYFEEQGKGFYVLPVGDQTYTGSALKPVVQVYDSVTYEDGSRERIELVLNRDYTVSYKNNKKASQEGKAQPTITVKGKGNYAGSQQITFRIVPKALTDADITAEPITVAYSGKVIKSVPTVYRGGKKLVRNTDYTVSYPLTETGAYKMAGSYPVVVTGKGGYSGTITVRQTITQDVLMSKVSVAKIPNQTYQNAWIAEKGGIAPETLKVTYKKQELVESKDGGLTGDYTVSYENNTAIGTATAVISAVEGSGYTGSKSVKYKITGTSITRAKVEGVTNRAYTGKEADARQPEGGYTLTLNDVVLQESRDDGRTGDYITVYANTAKAGTASVTFKGIHEYTGQIKKSYKITAYSIAGESGGQASAITMRYCTQDKPDEWQAVSTLSEITTPYVKGGSKPTVALYFNGAELTAGKDYTVKYANHNALSPTDQTEVNEKKLPKLTVTGKGSFKGSITGYYTITDGRLEQDDKITMTAKDVVYKGKKNAYKSTVTLKDCNGSKLAAGKDYDRNLVYSYAADASWSDADGHRIDRKAGDAVEAEDIPPANTEIRVTAKGIGAYAGTEGEPARTGQGDGGDTDTGDGTGDGGDTNIGDDTATDTLEDKETEQKVPEISATYRIVAADIAKAKLSAKAQIYRNGREITLTPEDLKVTVSGSPDPLQYGVDYVIDESTYANHKNKGKASVTIRGRGNYGGEKKITYSIGAKTLVWWKNLGL